MTVQKITKDTVTQIIGLAARTTNKLEADPDTALIPRLWERFNTEAIADCIKNRMRPDRVLAVYTNYGDADFSAPYTIIIGCEVDKVDDVPAGLVAHTIPAGSYAVITSAQGPVSEIVPAAWGSIWNISPSELEGKWAFTSNFEVYDARSADFSQGQIDIYLALE